MHVTSLVHCAFVSTWTAGGQTTDGVWRGDGQPQSIYLRDLAPVRVPRPAGRQRRGRQPATDARYMRVDKGLRFRMMTPTCASLHRIAMSMGRQAALWFDCLCCIVLLTSVRQTHPTVRVSDLT